jgi:predicted permease
MSNVRYAFRTLLKTPIVSLVAIISLALGIGANTAIFSVMDQILLERLPVSEPDRLVNLTSNGGRAGSNSTNVAGGIESIFSYPMFRDLEQKQTVFTGIAGHVAFGANLAFKNQTSGGQGMFVSGSYFPVLGAVPAAGRLFSPDDDKTPGGHRLVVLAYGYWSSHFNRDPSLINQQMIVDGVSMTIIGVAPEGFSGTSLGNAPDVFVPLSMREALQPGWKGLDNRRTYWVYLFARLRPGISAAQAEAAMNPLYHGIINEVDLPLQKGQSDRYKEQFRNQVMTLKPGSRGQSQVLTQASTPLNILLAITGFVLLIACANIANLLLARAAGRAREISIRLAVGAQRAQLVWQLLTEAVMLAVIGGLAGLAVSFVTVRLLISFMPPETVLPLSPSINPRSLAFALAASVVTGILFGIFPALHSTKQDLVTAIKDDAGSVSSSGTAARFRKVLVTGQIALSLLLLISAGLFLKSLVKIMQVDLGLRTAGVLQFELAPDRNQYKPDQTRNLYARLEESIAAIPNVENMSVSQVPLLANNNWGMDVSVDGFVREPDTDSNSRFNQVGPGYFRTLQIPLLQGREFTASDGFKAPKVAVVNEAFKRKFSPNQDIVGKKMQIGNGGKNDIEIVGLARDSKYSDVKDPAPPLFIRPYRQDDNLGGVSFYVLVRGAAASSVGAAIRHAVAELDPNLPIENMHTFDEQVGQNVFLDRMVTSLAAAFAMLATVLAAVGLYGVLAYSVARRTREIGIRLAIGAEPGAVRAMVLREVGLLALIGAVIGAPAAVMLARYAESHSQFYGVKSYDPMVVVGSTVLVIGVAMAAGYFPARFAMRVAPQTALRYE